MMKTTHLRPRRRLDFAKISRRRKHRRDLGAPRPRFEASVEDLSLAPTTMTQMTVHAPTILAITFRIAATVTATFGTTAAAGPARRFRFRRFRFRRFRFRHFRHFRRLPHLRRAPRAALQHGRATAPATPTATTRRATTTTATVHRFRPASRRRARRRRGRNVRIRGPTLTLAGFLDAS